MQLNPGDTFDRYTIEAEVGEGGMGRVYRAYDNRLHRRVALKLLRFDAEEDEQAKADAAARLQREARAAAALNHPNAVSIFDVAEVEGTIYIAMEFVDGKTLRTYVGDASVPRENRLRWLTDTARALAAAHERGLVHRDVKPENIMVREDGVVKVLDFGIAKRIPIDVKGSSQDVMTTTLSTQGTVLGTPRYLSPEQVRAEAVDGRSDQFSWGVVAYELLTGKLPWNEDGRTGLQLLLAILSQAPEPPTKLVPDLPAIVEATILKALAKSPADRFASMEYVVSSLEAFITASRRNVVEVFGTHNTLPAPPLAPESRATSLSSARPPARWKPAAIAGVAFAAAIALVAYARKPPGSAPLAASASATPDPDKPTAMLDQRLPAGSAEAQAAFRAYLQSFRDGVFEAARQALDRTVTIDPTMAAAYMRLAFMDSLVSSDEADVRRTFKKAVQFRASLSDRDQLLLDALEPYLQREPSDPPECEKRLAAAVEKYPKDAELAYYLGSVRFDRGQLDAAIVAFDRAIAIDPKFAQAWAAKGGCQAYLGRLDEARSSLDECLAISSSATECMWYRAQFDEQDGACDKEESDVHAWIGRDPEDYYAYHWLAKSLFALGKSEEAVRTALEQKWVRVSKSRRDKIETQDRIRLDLAAGDFAAAEKKTLDLEQRLAVEPGALAHAEPHSMLVEIYRETGRDADARKIAEAYVARKDAWVTPHRVDDRAIWEDALPLMLSTMLHTGALTPTQFDERRGEWLRGWESKTSGAYVNYLWIYGYALPVESAADAQAAMATLAKYSPLPKFTPTSLASAYVGRALFEAGRVDEAIAELSRATKSCIALYLPIAHTRASLHLGQALETKGDKAGACAAYAKVVERWGRAKPRSITAERAKARMSALRCAK